MNNGLNDWQVTEELLMKYIAGNATEKEKVRVMKWLEDKTEHLQELKALRKLYDILIWQGASSSSTGKTVRERTFFRKFTTEVLKIAAVALTAFMIAHYLPFSRPKPKTALQRISVPAGQHVALTMEDGTKIWLNTKSNLTFPELFPEGKREVYLEGEGYFDVAENPEKPFVVHAAGYQVHVLGTEFNVSAYTDRGNFEASLVKGRIELITENGNRLTVSPNERVYLKAGNLIREPIENFEHFSWRDGLISFQNELFTDMVQKMELYFDIRIECSNDRLRNYRCTGKFHVSDGVEQILKVLQLRNDFRYKIDKNEKLITIY